LPSDPQAWPSASCKGGEYDGGDLAQYLAAIEVGQHDVERHGGIIAREDVLHATLADQQKASIAQVFALHGAKTPPARRAVRLPPGAAGGEDGPHTCAKTPQSVIEVTHHALSGFSTAPRGPVLFRMRKKGAT
jgi:hypothetical protein